MLYSHLDILIINSMNMFTKEKKPIKREHMLGGVILGILIVFLGYLMLQNGVPVEDGKLLPPSVTAEELAAVDSSAWAHFTHPDFAYTFVVPPNGFMARTFSSTEGDVSLLVPGEQKQTFAISSGEEYYLYLYPEGGYDRDDLAVNGKTPVETYSEVFQGKDVVREIYDAENVIIRFPDYHDFRIQLFVKEGKKEGWLTVEKILSLMDVTEGLPPREKELNVMEVTQ